MGTSYVRSRHARSGERGFALLDLLIGISIMSGMLLALVTTTRHPSADPHPSALALQLAMSEARGLALTNGGLAPGSAPTGATVVVAVDPSDPTRSVISVYASRPVVTTVLSAGNGGAPGIMTIEAGRPPVVVPGRFDAIDGSTTTGGDFAITVGASGIVDFVPGYRSGEAPLAGLTACSPGATVGVAIGASSERHALACQDGIYDANAWLPAGEPRRSSAP